MSDPLPTVTEPQPEFPWAQEVTAALETITTSATSLVTAMDGKLSDVVVGDDADPSWQAEFDFARQPRIRSGPSSN